MLINIALTEYELNGKIHFFKIHFRGRLLLLTENHITVAQDSGNDQSRLIYVQSVVI